MNPYRAVAVFVSMTILDILWALYIARVGEKKPLSSACMATFMWVFGAFVVVSYTEDPVYLVPAAIGSFIGTYFAVKYDRAKPATGN